MRSSQLIQSIQIDWSRIDPSSYLRNIEAINNIGRIDFVKPVTFFVGENGTGKSTLLEAIAVAYGFNPEGGTRNYSFSTYDSHSELCDAITITRGVKRARWGYFLRAESFYNVATQEEEYGKSPGGMSQGFHKMSHGESFLEVIRTNFRGNGFYLLDEPEASLSPQRQLTLLLEIYRCTIAGAQFIIASHSPILLALPCAEILSFDDGRIHPCSYEETQSYKIMSLFMNHREQVLKKLFE